MHEFSRRDWLRFTAASLAGCSMSGWLSRLAAAEGDNPERKRACILLWMAGGPSQMDTWDLKPGHANGGSFKETDTDVPGIKISEHLPQLAKCADKLAIIRSMKTKEADHGRGTYLMRTGRVPGGPIQYPALGAFVGKELGPEESALPNFVSIAPFRFLSPGAYDSGFLGPKYAPLFVGEGGPGRVIAPQGQQQDVAAQLKVQDLDLPSGVKTDRAKKREGLLDDMEKDFNSSRPGLPGQSHRTAYQRALTMMRSEAVKAFDITTESKKLRDRYGNNLFGQGCLLARRLVERGVPFVEVTLSGVGQQALGWDTHQNNFDAVKRLSQVLDPAFATLIDDLKDRGLLDTTTIVWMGEFGRTPRINGNSGRDHWANSWSTVLAGGGIKGGQVVGQTSPDGIEVKDRPVAVSDLLGTVCKALGLDITKQNQSNVGRPIRLVDTDTKPIKEVLS